MCDSVIIDNSYETVYDAIMAAGNVDNLQWFDEISSTDSVFKTCKTFLELNDKIISHFPFDSYEYEYFRRCIFEEHYLKPMYKHEYVLGWAKASPYPNNRDMEFFNNLGYFNEKYHEIVQDHEGFTYRMEVLPRYVAEYNPNYVHLVVGTIPFTKDNKFVLMKRKYGQYAGSLTMVEGHVSYNEYSLPGFYRIMMPEPKELNRDGISELIRRETIREVTEEIGCHVVSEWYNDFNSVYYQPPMFISPNRISYFHAGFLTSVMVEETSDQIVSMEPEKNDVVVMTPEELHKIQIAQTDIWLYNFIKARL